jgi:hypothetical protein
MKKIIFTLCTLSTLLFEGICQNVTYQTGSLNNEEVKTDYGVFLANGEYLNVSLLKYIGHGYENILSVQSINTNALFVKNQYTMNFGSLKHDTLIEKIFGLKDNLFCFYSTFNKKTKMRILSASQISNNKDKLRNEVLFESKEPKVFLRSSSDMYRYEFKKSSNNNYCLIKYILPPSEKRAKLNKDVLGFSLFDKGFNKIFSKEIQMSYTENLI